MDSSRLAVRSEMRSLRLADVLQASPRWQADLPESGHPE